MINQISSNKACPCCSGKLANECCLPYLKSKIPPAHARDLMRSRYTAFALGAVDYLLLTSSASLRQHLTKEDLLDSCKLSDFIHLEIIDYGSHSEIQFVEFKAKILTGDELSILHEKSWFLFEEGTLKYDRGDIFPTKPIRIKRNDVCPCGSGVKFKKCHGK